MMSDISEKNFAVVRKLCGRWHYMTREEYRECMAPGCEYINMPRLERKRIGPDEAFEALEHWRGRCKINLEILHMTGDDQVVMAERLERFEDNANGKVIELYVAGVFEMNDGKIARWRDYFELSHAPSVILADT